MNATKWPRTMREIIERQLSLFGGENTRKPPDRSNLAHSRATARGFSRCSITSEETIVSNGRLQAVSRTLLAGAEARSRLRRQMRRYLEVYKAAAGAADTQRTISVDEITGIQALGRPERHRAGWPCALMAKSQTHRRNQEGRSSWLAANLSH